MRQNRQNKSESDRLLTTTEVADRLRVHQRTVQRWISLNRLKAIKAGPRVWRVREKDLDEFLARNNSQSQED